MRKQEIHKFIRQLMLMAIPIWVLLLLYVCLDPFRVVWHYERFFQDNTPHVGLNMDYVSTENFIDRNDSLCYDAFIMGNSRSQYWRTADWQDFVGSDARCYHYYGNGESLLALTENLEYIDRCGNDIRHALLIVDADLLCQTSTMQGHLYCRPPRTCGYRNAVAFHASCLAAFLKPMFMVAYTDFALFRQLRPYMVSRYFFEQPVVYCPETNEVRDSIFDAAIAQGTYYTPERLQKFCDKQHPDSISPPVVTAEGMVLLQRVARVFRKHATDCRIVVSPLYNQVKLHPADLAALRSVFGRDCVFDFSGKSDINADYHNYYEDSHYRPFIARRLMGIIYKTEHEE